MALLADSAIGLIASGFGFMGLIGLVAPARVSDQFEVPELSLAGRSEVRAVYGGFGIAMSSLLAIALAKPRYRSGICLTAGTALAGMAGGRVFSALADRSIGRGSLSYLCIESAGATLLIAGA